MDAKATTGTPVDVALDVLQLNDNERKALFAKEGEIERLLTSIEESHVIEADISTPKGRQEIASFAYRVSRQKAALDAAGKALGDAFRKKLDDINAKRRQLRDRLDALHDKIRFPLDQWEKEEAACKERLEQRLAQFRALADWPAQAGSVEIQQRLDRIPALMGNEPWGEFEEEAAQTREDIHAKLSGAFTAAQAREAEQAELQRLRREREDRERRDREEAGRRRRGEEERQQREREEAIAREAGERALKEAEERAAREAEERERQRQEELIAAKLAQEKAEREAHEATERAERAAREERDRIELEARRQREVEDAKTARRLADEEHRKKIRSAATAALTRLVGEDKSGSIVAAIENGEVPHISLNF